MKTKLTRKEHPYAPGFFTGSYDSKAINALADNVVVSRIGQCVRDAFEAPSGDSIDRGLVMVRLLHEQGFEVRLIDG